MSRKAVFLAFDGVIEGAGSVYSDAALNDALGEYDQLGLQAISDLINGTSPTLTVQIYHTCDPRQGMDAIWTTKNGTAEINGVTLTAATTNNHFGSDAGTTPSTTATNRMQHREIT